MEDIDLRRLGRVKAPPNFEKACLSALSGKRRQIVRQRYLRLSLSGAFSALLIAALIVGVFILPDGGGIDLSSLEGKLPAELETETGSFWILPITESVGYAQEIRNFSSEAPTVYILEQVTDRTDTKIKY